MRRTGTIDIDGAVVEVHHLWYVREELKLYPRRKQRLAFLQTVIVTETSVNETPGIQAGTVSNPTLGRATALMTDQECAWLRLRVDWIERVWINLDEVTQRVLNLLVIKATHTAAGAAMEVEDFLKRADPEATYSEASVYRELNRGLLAFALDQWGDPIIIKGRRPRKRAAKVSEKTAEVRVFGGSDPVKSVS